jgi:1-acyl-sn-glycerol-3-phosphate acyltransferase
LDRQAHREASLRGLLGLARLGNAVLIFPQGTHTHLAEEQGNPPTVRFKTGVAHLAAALDATVVPFGLAGSEVAMPAVLDDFHGTVIAGVPVAITRTPLAIAFGAPVKRGDDEAPQAFAERLEAVCYQLAREAQAAHESARAAWQSARRR